MGVIYQGNFHQNELHGNGKIIFPSLNLQIGLMAVAKHELYENDQTYIYIGEFNQGNIEGTGKFVSYKDCIKVGTFKDGKLDGKCWQIYYPEGHVYDGGVSRDRPHGKGKIIILFQTLLHILLVLENLIKSHNLGRMIFSSGKESSLIKKSILEHYTYYHSLINHKS